MRGNRPPRNLAEAMGHSFRRTALFASVAGILGACLWGYLGFSEQTEGGFVAWAIGGAVGVAAVVGNRGRHVQVGILAAVVSAISIVLGKSLMVFLVLRELGGGLLDVAAALPAVFSEYAVLWFGLALYTAFRIGNSPKPDW